MNCLKIKDIFRVLRNKSLVFNEFLIISFATFEPSQFTVKSKDVFLNGVSLLLSLSARSSRKKGSANLPTALLRLFVLNASTHNQPTILQDFLSCAFLALGNHLKNSLENIPHPYSVNFLLHNLKIQPL